MLQFPVISSTPAQDELIKKIHFFAEVLRAVPVPPSLATHIFHRQFLKSSLFSARIEGNTLTLADAEQTNLSAPKAKSQQEVSNVLKTLHQLKTHHYPFTQENLLQLHTQIMTNLDPKAGRLRAEASAIYDQWGNVVYLTPSPEEMQDMLTVLFIKLQAPPSADTTFSQILANHYYFEKIHPFLDGNGRTGRAILQFELQQVGLFGEYIIPIDEYFEKNRQEYYFHLEKNTRHIEEFVLFFLKGLVESLESLLQEIKQAGEQLLTSPQTQNQSHSLDVLLPRRQEICRIIEDHPYASLDMIARRFPTIPRRTIAFDIQWLVKHKYLTKHGSTRGVRYSRSSENTTAKTHA